MGENGLLKKRHVEPQAALPDLPNPAKVDGLRVSLACIAPVNMRDSSNALVLGGSHKR